MYNLKLISYKERVSVIMHKNIIIAALLFQSYSLSANTVEYFSKNAIIKPTESNYFSLKNLSHSKVVLEVDQIEIELEPLSGSIYHCNNSQFLGVSLFKKPETYREISCNKKEIIFNENFKVE